jgi:hypothetical protein
MPAVADPPAPHLDRSLLPDDAITLGQAARLCPPSRAGRPVSPATLTRWISTGIRTRNGSRVKLQAVRGAVVG